jgi:hypothetical protein
METRKRPRQSTIALFVIGGLGLLLYAWFLSTYFATAYGDAVVGQAIEALMALFLLWLVLVLLLTIDRVIGGPSWPRRAGFLVIPVTAIATTFATDYPSDKLCQLGVVGVPLVMGVYVLAGRLPAQSAARAQTAILLLFAAFSAYAIRLFLF